MTIRTLSMILTALALMLFCVQPVLAHCGKCGMGGEKMHHEMKEKMAHDCGDCQHKGNKDHDCSECKLHGKHAGMLKCAECEKAGHKGHHEMHQEGGHGHGHDGHHEADDGKLDDLFDKDKS